jgi:hypothetical protein
MQRNHGLPTFSGPEQINQPSPLRWKITAADLRRRRSIARLGTLAFVTLKFIFSGEQLKGSQDAKP